MKFMRTNEEAKIRGNLEKQRVGLITELKRHVPPNRIPTKPHNTTKEIAHEDKTLDDLLAEQMEGVDAEQMLVARRSYGHFNPLLEKVLVDLDAEIHPKDIDSTMDQSLSDQAMADRYATYIQKQNSQKGAFMTAVNATPTPMRGQGNKKRRLR
jgi:hypothetical protein